MFRQTGTLQPATEPASPDRIAPASKALQSRRYLVAAALMSLLLATAFWVSFGGGRSALLGAEPSAQGGRDQPHTGPSSLPAAAQASLSRSLGEADPAYGVKASPGGFQAATPEQRLHVSFGASAVQLMSGPLRIGLSLRAVGYGDTLRPLHSVAPRARANRVVYAHRGLSEWYANGPFGLEQGFGVTRPPAGTTVGPLTLSMTLSGNARASLAAGGSSLLLSARGRPTLRYGGLIATDARGRTLPSWLELRGGKVLLRVDVRGARYPLRVDPFIQQAKLTGSGASGPAQLGFGVALSPDGNTALIGAPEENGGTGAAWVFTRSGSTWTQQGAKLTGAGESGAGRFGTSVALSSNGDTALIGAPADAGSGAAWVFTRSGSTWTQQGELTGSDASGSAHFGNSVALSADGSTALIGGPEDGGRLGAAWVFARAGSSWTQQGAKLTGGEEAGSGEFGFSVALSSDGSTALIGGPEDNSFTGAAWVFARAGSTWAQQGAKLAGGGESGGGAFGNSVALSGDGSTALIGGLADNFAGAAWVFTRTGSSWTQQGSKLTSGTVDEGHTGEPLGAFGSGVALSGDGDTALIGGPGERVNPGGAPFVGSTWLFTRSGGTWSAGSRLTAGEENGAGYFGYSVALSASGGTALIGGPEDSTKLGAAWAFVNPEAATRGELTGVSSSEAPGPKSKLGAPVISHVTQSRNRWRERDQVAHISRAEARLFVAAAGASSSPFTHTSKRGKYRVFYYHGLTGHEYSKPTEGGVGRKHNIVMVIPAGTTFSFTLNVQAAVSFTFTQNLSGRRLKGKCVAATNGVRRQPACTRAVTQGTLSPAGKAGRNSVPFQGLIPGSRKLPAGAYTLVIRAANAAGRSGPKSLRFTIFG